MDTVRIANYSQKSFCIWRQNIHYHLANLWNRIKTKIYVIFRMITLKQQKFSQSGPVLIRPKLASVLIRAHLWKVPLFPRLKFDYKNLKWKNIMFRTFLMIWGLIKHLENHNQTHTTWNRSCSSLSIMSLASSARRHNSLRLPKNYIGVHLRCFRDPILVPRIEIRVPKNHRKSGP